MGKNLAQAPLTAIIFAAIWCFIEPFTFLLFSEGYREALSAFTMPFTGYAYITAYGFWLSIILALVISNARGKGMVLLILTSVPMLFTQWITPSVRQIVFGETTGVMTRNDTIFTLGVGSGVTLFLFVMAALLFKPPPPEPEPPKKPNTPPKKPDKYRLKKRNFVILLIILPVIYMVIFFLTWHYLLLNSEAARVYYTGNPERLKFSTYLVNMMLDDNKQIPMALLKGALYSLPLISLMLQFAHKRVMFVITSVMLLLGPVLRMLIPDAVMPADVRFAHLIEMSAAAVAFGLFASVTMHLCVYKEKPPEPPPKAHKAAPVAVAPAAEAPTGAHPAQKA